MNSSYENLTNIFLNQSSCGLFLFSPSGWHIGLNFLRFFVFFLYIIWFLIAFRIKEFHDRNMAFLYNLNIVSLLRSIIGIQMSLMPFCFKPTLEYCYVQSIISVISAYIPGYALSLLGCIRMISFFSIHRRKKISWKAITATLAVTWGLPIALAFYSFFMGGKSVRYFPEVQQCLIYYSGGVVTYVINIILGYLLPNIVVLVTYITVSIKVRCRRRFSSRQSELEPPRITFQIFIYILTYEIAGVLGFIVAWATVSQNLSNLSESLLQLIRLLTWLQHYCPLGLLYFNPILLQRYKRFFKWH